MLEEFLNHRLYIYLNDVSDKMITRLANIIGDIRWSNGTPLHDVKIKQHLNHYYLACENNRLCYSRGDPHTYRVGLGDWFRIVTLDYFLEECEQENIKFKNIDALSVFAGEYDA